MPQVRGSASDTEAHPAGRIAGTRRLLTTAALIMSGFLLTSSFSTVVLIPAQEFQPGGEANGLTVDCGVRADGLIGTDGLIEIKSPALEPRHLRTVESGKCPDDYLAQVQV